MPDEEDVSIEHITELAIQDVSRAITEKVGRDLSDDERSGVAKIVGTEHFWARAEEMLMFVRHRSADDVAAMIAGVGNRYREWRDSNPMDT